MRHGRPYGHGPWSGGERPPWWPEGEPVPARGWRGRRGMPPRIAAFLFVMFVLFASFLAFVVWVMLQTISAVAGGPPPPLAVVLVVVFLVFALTAGARTGQRFARPIGDLINAAERVAEGDYSARVALRGPRDVRTLANAFNAMSARLERSETERRRLLADVTHELRTPLTVVRGNVEALIDGVHPADDAHLRAILDETEVLSRLVDDLRTVSVAEAGALALHREPTDIAALARDVAASFQATAAAQGVRLEVEVAMGPTEANVDPLRVREILTNVVANGLRYTPRDGSVRIVVTPFERDLSIAVRDTGPGIAPEVLPHVFERFTRSPESPGAGLGLAIAKSLVTAHGGSIEARSAPGQGTEIVLTLPRAAP